MAWGGVKQTPRPESEWIRTTDEKRRIVPEDLWKRVQSRRENTNKRELRFESGRICGGPRKRATQNLLAGLATCSLCGGGLIVETSPRKRGRVPEYVCARRRLNGTCANALRINVGEVNEAVLRAVEETGAAMPILKSTIAVLSLFAIVGSADAQTSTRTFDDFVVTIGPEEGTEGTWFRIDWDNGQVGTFLVPNVFGPSTLARDLNVYGTSRLIIEFAPTLLLVDPASGSVVDRFSVLRSAVSPSGRYLAIQRHTPNGVAFVDAVYSIYDLQKTPTENRPQNATSAGAGWIVYPTANVTAQNYWVATQASDAHSALSPLTWVTPHMLAVVDYHSGVATVVLVDVEPGLYQFRRAETALSTSDFLEPSAAAAAALRFLRVKELEALAVTSSVVSLRLEFEAGWFLKQMELNVQATRPQ